ncbi:MAG: hypothetical protein ACE5HF_02365 [Gemmatimonadota bacterium]
MFRRPGAPTAGLRRRLALGALGVIVWLAGVGLEATFVSGVGVGLLAAALLLGIAPGERPDADGAP